MTGVFLARRGPVAARLFALLVLFGLLSGCAPSAQAEPAPATQAPVPQATAWESAAADGPEAHGGAAVDTSAESAATVSAVAVGAAEGILTAPESVVIGSYNVQAFGPAKIGRPNTRAALARVASRFDLLALQEVGSNASTASDATCEAVMAAFVESLDAVAGQPKYAYVRADQFAIVYRQDLFELLAWEPYSGSESFAYPPLAAHLRVRGAPFDFVIVSVHIRPGAAAAEISSLRAAAQRFSERFAERDVMLVGDFNADGSYYEEGEGGFLAGFLPNSFITVVPNDADTTVAEGDNAYDRIQLTAAMIEDWTGSWSVVRPADLIDVSICEGPPSVAGTEAALSDHYPVRAEFWTQRDED